MNIKIKVEIWCFPHDLYFQLLLLCSTCQCWISDNSRVILEARWWSVDKVSSTWQAWSAMASGVVERTVQASTPKSPLFYTGSCREPRKFVRKHRPSGEPGFIVQNVKSKLCFSMKGDLEIFSRFHQSEIFDIVAYFA